MIRILVIVNLVLLLALGAYVFFRPSSGKTVFVINGDLFAGFKGKKMLEEKLNGLRTQNKRLLDSLSFEAGRSNKPEVIRQIQATADNIRMSEQQISQQYTEDIWKRINTYMVDFGKDKGYAYVFGASGNGNLMFAADALNVTDEAVSYINKKYDEGQ